MRQDNDNNNSQVNKNTKNEKSRKVRCLDTLLDKNTHTNTKHLTSELLDHSVQSVLHTVGQIISGLASHINR